MKIIDTDKWKRKAPYECFSKYDNPIFALSTRLDVTKLVRHCKLTGDSFFANVLYVAVKCLNGIEDFRIRIKDGKVVLFDKCDPNYIVINNDGVIVTCRTEYSADYKTFYKSVRSDTEFAKQSTSGVKFSDRAANDVFYVSCLPWLDFVSVINPYDLKDVDSSSIPRLTWGKFTEENGRYKMTMDIAAHHALLDGYPLTQAFALIQNMLDNIENFLG